MRSVIMFVWMAGTALVGVHCGESGDFDAANEDESDGGGLIDAGESLNGLQVINPSCGAGTGGEQDECDDCVTNACSAEFEECFGSSWQTDLGGICATFGACIQACDCGDPECFGTCSTDLENSAADSCLSCVRSLLQCEVAECDSACTDADQADGGPVDGGSAPRDASGDGRP